ncbi:hypothetical protein BGX33_004250 [Mortierella sp. NVP41]|nr:hypothetical protein BGX33_004250 [Mortierella sp. NVP41]
MASWARHPGTRAFPNIRLKQEFAKLKTQGIRKGDEASYQAYNEPYQGGLGSYGLILMAISFLQMHPLHQKGQSDPQKHLGQLLIDFLQLYGKRFKYRWFGLSVTDRGFYMELPTDEDNARNCIKVSRIIARPRHIHNSNIAQDDTQDPVDLVQSSDKDPSSDRDPVHEPVQPITDSPAQNVAADIGHNVETVSEVTQETKQDIAQTTENNGQVTVGPTAQDTVERKQLVILDPNDLSNNVTRSTRNIEMIAESIAAAAVLLRARIAMDWTESSSAESSSRPRDFKVKRQSSMLSSVFSVLPTFQERRTAMSTLFHSGLYQQMFEDPSGAAGLELVLERQEREQDRARDDGRGHGDTQDDGDVGSSKEHPALAIDAKPWMKDGADFKAIRLTLTTELRELEEKLGESRGQKEKEQERRIWIASRCFAYTAH